MSNLTPYDVRDELLSHLRAILAAHPLGGTAELGEPGPSGLIGVYDTTTGDLIGAGHSECEALEDAIETVEGWEE